MSRVLTNEGSSSLRALTGPHYNPQVQYDGILDDSFTFGRAQAQHLDTGLMFPSCLGDTCLSSKRACPPVGTRPCVPTIFPSPAPTGPYVSTNVTNLKCLPPSCCLLPPPPPPLPCATPPLPCPPTGVVPLPAPVVPVQPVQPIQECPTVGVICQNGNTGQKTWKPVLPKMAEPYPNGREVVGVRVDPWTGESFELTQNVMPPPNTEKGQRPWSSIARRHPRMVQLMGGYDRVNDAHRKEANLGYLQDLAEMSIQNVTSNVQTSQANVAKWAAAQIDAECQLDGPDGGPRSVTIEDKLFGPVNPVTGARSTTIRIPSAQEAQQQLVQSMDNEFMKRASLAGRIQPNTQPYVEPVRKIQQNLVKQDLYHNRNGLLPDKQIGREVPYGYVGYQNMARFLPYVIPTQQLDTIQSAIITDPVIPGGCQPNTIHDLGGNVLNSRQTQELLELQKPHTTTKQTYNTPAQVIMPIGDVDPLHGNAEPQIISIGNIKTGLRTTNTDNRNKFAIDPKQSTVVDMSHDLLKPGQRDAEGTRDPSKIANDPQSLARTKGRVHSQPIVADRVATMPSIDETTILRQDDNIVNLAQTARPNAIVSGNMTGSVLIPVTPLERTNNDLNSSVENINTNAALRRMPQISTLIQGGQSNKLGTESAGLSFNPSRSDDHAGAALGHTQTELDSLGNQSSSAIVGIHNNANRSDDFVASVADNRPDFQQQRATIGNSATLIPVSVDGKASAHRNTVETNFGLTDQSLINNGRDGPLLVPLSASSTDAKASNAYQEQHAQANMLGLYGNTNAVGNDDRHQLQPSLMTNPDHKWRVSENVMIPVTTRSVDLSGQHNVSLTDHTGQFALMTVDNSRRSSTAETGKRNIDTRVSNVFRNSPGISQGSSTTQNAVMSKRERNTKRSTCNASSTLDTRTFDSLNRSGNNALGSHVPASLAAVPMERFSSTSSTRSDLQDLSSSNKVVRLFQ